VIRGDTVEKRIATLGLIVATGALSPRTAAAEDWTFLGAVTGGTQFDVVTGPDETIHLVSDHYVQLDASGAILLSESVGDPEQSPLFHAPALAVDPDGTVHLVVRAGGGFDAGYTLQYRTRSPAGVWTDGVDFDTPIQWNWQVGVASAGDGAAYLMSTRKGDNVWADLRLFEANGSSVSHLGDISGWYRVDNSALLRGRNGVIALAAGDNSQPTRLSLGLPGDSLFAALSSGAQHAAGTGGDHGLPCVYFDDANGVHLSYGSGFTNHDQFPSECPSCVDGEVHYNRYAVDGTAVFAADRTVMTGLDTWHLSIGMSAVAATDDGDEVVMVALQTHDEKEASASTLTSSFSIDAGATWSPQLDTGRSINGGEGRLRPRMVALGKTVYLLYADNAQPGQVSLAMMQFPADPDDPPAGDDDDGGNADDGTSDDGEDGSDGPAAGTTGDAGSGDGADDALPTSSTFGLNEGDAGCSCRGSRRAPTTMGFVAVLLAAFFRRRKSMPRRERRQGVGRRGAGENGHPPRAA